MAGWTAGVLSTGYLARSRPSLYLGIAALVGWYCFQLANWQFTRMGPAGLTGFAAFIPLGLLLGLGELQRRWPRTEFFSGAFTKLGLLVALAPFLLFSFAAFWRNMGSDIVGGTSTEATQLNVTFGALSRAALVIAGAVLARHRDRAAQSFAVGTVC